MIVTNRPTGLGAGGSSIVGAAGATAGTIIGILPTLIPALGIAGPVGLAIGGVIAAGAALASAFGVGSGCGQTCIDATNVVNQAEPVFKQNLDAYENGEITQSQAESAFSQMMTAIQQACAKIPGSAGTNCVADRQAGACKWRATSQPYPASPAVGSCWNWDNGYRVPLLSPPVNAPSMGPSTVSGSVTSLLSGTSSNTLLLAGAVVVGVILISSGN